jgi:hypothetical protein
MRISQDIRDQAAGMAAKAEEFREAGGELYVTLRADS